MSLWREPDWHAMGLPTPEELKARNKAQAAQNEAALSRVAPVRHQPGSHLFKPDEQRDSNPPVTSRKEAP